MKLVISPKGLNMWGQNDLNLDKVIKSAGSIGTSSEYPLIIR